MTTRGTIRRRLPSWLVAIALLLTAIGPSGAAIEGTRKGSVNSYRAFLYRTESHPQHVLLADVTGDGRADAVMSTGSYIEDERWDFKLMVFPGGPGGGIGTPQLFETHGGGPSTMQLAHGDVDSDGAEDVAVATTDGIDVFFGDGDGLEPAATFFPLTRGTTGADVLVEDFDADGDDELLAVTDKGVLLWTGASTRVPTPTWLTVSGQSLAYSMLTDVTGDGLPDYVGASVKEVFVFRQEAPGSLRPEPDIYRLRDSSWHVRGLASGDVDGDGDNDLVAGRGATIPDSFVETLLQTDGALQPGPRYRVFNNASTVGMHDMNGDGRLDVVVIHDGWASAGILHQTATGRLRQEELYVIGSRNGFPSMGIGDLTGDPRPDIVVPSFQPEAGIYESQTGLNVLEARDRARSRTTLRTYLNSRQWRGFVGRVRGADVWPGWPRHVHDVRMTFYAEGKKGFVKLESEWLLLQDEYDDIGMLVRTRMFPKWATRCKAVAAYGGNSYFLPSRASVTFPC